MVNTDGGKTALSGAGKRAIPLGEAFDLLRAPRRRWMLDYLRNAEVSTASLQTIAEQVHERQISHRATADKPLQDVYMELYHTHVPRLDRADITSYDQQDETIRLEALPAPLPELLEVADEKELTNEND